MCIYIYVCVWHAYMIMPSIFTNVFISCLKLSTTKRHIAMPRLVAEGQLDAAAQLCEAQPEEWRLDGGNNGGGSKGYPRIE